MRINKNIDMFEYEKKYISQGYKNICGIDEAGRGPLAGPVCASAVILDENVEIEGLNDSKKLTEKKREFLYNEIINKAKAYSIVFIDHTEIDKINILQATMQAMAKSVIDLSIKPDVVMIDGNQVPNIDKDIEAFSLVKGDALSASIAAASILAKVSRDRLMVEMDKKYPGYFFAKHKGYPTKLHYERIEELGLCDIHRKSFCKKIKSIGKK